MGYWHYIGYAQWGGGHIHRSDDKHLAVLNR